jgi:enterochelin esterase-like enzyme
VVRVYTPPDHDPTRGAPLLVMFDGQNIFDDEPSFAGGWHAHRAIDRLGKRRPRPVIAAINHGGVDRIHELSPWEAHGSRGQLDLLLRWVTDGLLPRLRSSFSAGAGPAATTIGGSSLGGLAALYAHFQRPDVFGSALAMSPSLWFAQRRIFEWLQGAAVPWSSRVYLDCGGREARGAMMEHARSLAQHLNHRGYDKDRLRFHEDAGGLHNERAWRRRLPGALRFLYRVA